MKKHLAKTTILFITASVVFVLVAAVYFFLYEAIADARAKVVSSSAELSVDIQRNNDLDAIRKNITSTLADHDKLTSLFVGSDAVADFIQNIENLAKGSGLSVETQGVETIDSPDLAPVEKELLSMSVQTDGSWADTMQFVSLLSNLPYKLSVTTFSLEKVTAKDAATATVKKPAGLVWESSVHFTVVKIKAPETPEVTP